MEQPTFTETMIAVLNGPVIDEHNTKMCLIARIFKRNKFIGIEDSQLRKNRLYFNNQFDYLYDQSNEQLESIDHILSQHCSHIHEERMKVMKGTWYGHKE